MKWFKFCLLCFVCSIFTGCNDDLLSGYEAMPPITVAKPVVRDITLSKSYPGYVSAQNSVNLVARVSGYLEDSFYDAGSKVEKGKLLFLIEPTQYQDEVLSAESSLENAIAKRDYAQNNYTRMKEASASNAISEIDLIEAKSQLVAAEADVKNAEASLSLAKTNLSYCYVKAPFRGRVTIGTLSNGNYVNGSASPVILATIFQEDLMYAYFNIEDNQYLKMLWENKQMPFDSVEVFFDSPTRRVYKGKIDYIAPNIDLSMGTLRLRAEIKNHNGELKDGMFANVMLPYTKRDNALLIDDASIGFDQLGSFIYVINDSSEVEYRHITVGEVFDDTLRYVVSGLDKGEMYVSKALLKVRDGMKVNPVLK